MGGWNKGIANSSSGFTGKHHSPESKEKLRNRPKEIYKKPYVNEYGGNELCMYGCGQAASYQFKSGKLCCSRHYNSCPQKRKDFSDRADHARRAVKSLATRTKLGITKSSREKAMDTMRKEGTLVRLGKMTQERWKERPWNNHGPRGEWVLYKDTTIGYQGSYEFHFLNELELRHGIDWLIENVKRGPAIWYYDPVSDKKRLYISDYIINNTIYEIKSSYTWNKKGKDLNLEITNKAKLNECIMQGYNVKLIKDKIEVDINAQLMG
jgi:hypothetical protein